MSATWLADDDILLHHVATFWARRHEPNLLLVHYNDLKADLEGEMRRVARFLEIEVPAARWPAVIQACTFEPMRSHGAESVIFKGMNGRWRDVLTPAELAAYELRVAEVLPPDAAAWLARGRSALAG
jgi:aryl sulfotransferase